MIRPVALFLHVTVGTCAAAAALGVLLVNAPATAQTPASGQPRTGGTVRYGWPAEPTTLNQYFTSAQSPKHFADFSLEGLARGGANGSYLSILALEVPTQANGEVSPDGTVVTWKLKSGVACSDGEPFTGHDVVFTYQMIMDPANPVLDRSDSAAMSSVTAPDEHTVVVTYKQLSAPYRLAFPSVLPAHCSTAARTLPRTPSTGRRPLLPARSCSSRGRLATRSPRRICHSWLCWPTSASTQLRPPRSCSSC